MTLRRWRWTSAAILVALAFLACGCAATAVKPWDRDLLSEKKMRFIPLPMVNAVDEHIYFSKEGSTGGTSAAGGGCGCN
jgi:hypothetical protein